MPAAATRWTVRRKIGIALAVVLTAFAIFGGVIYATWQPNKEVSVPPVPPRNIASAASHADYVGATTCGQCHLSELKAWTGSHHQLAMQEANAATVLGDFNNATFRYQDVESAFFKRDGKFVVRTDGPDGKLTDYDIKYVFGVTPLQQYLIEFPGGRYQALSIAWDARPKDEGGQRWFHLYPHEKIDHKDALHWTGLYQNLEPAMRDVPLDEPAQKL